jgi:regulator of protease activity HflC (stomatin/prohibitin superfamily)
MKCALQSLESVEKVNGWNKDSVVGRHCIQSAHFLRQAIAEAEDAVAAEREACARLVEADADARGKGGGGLVLLKAAIRIRARGEK